MKLSRSLRILLLALIVALVPASSFAGVFISVNFAPPILPVYDQPPCPEPGWMWTPGYWAYDEDGYYWVPGTWVPVPYEGALWTPPYWGWSDGFYVFHPGYWGPHVGYYGGVNYGFGYMGIGFVGGMWRGHDFVYNTAVMHVNERFVHNTYIDRTIVERNTIVNDRHVAYSGGPGGIRHDPRPEERFADRDRHVDATTFQRSHESVAMSDRSMYSRNNGGHPSNAAVARPWGGGNQGGPGAYRSAPTRMQQNQGGGAGNQGPGNYNSPRPYNGNPDNRGYSNARPSNANPDNRGNYNSPRPYNGNPDNRGYSNARPGNANPDNRGNYNSPRPYNGNPDNRNYNGPHSNQGNAPSRPAPEYRQAPQPQQRPAPQFESRPAPQQRPGPQFESRPAPQPESRPAPQQRDNGGQGRHGDPRDH
ncbi:MAG TPA: hypothetical protein VGT08_12145 [Terracidiphilus sp.]|nr:hypothetical protein [Terracidiphilus sp.]